MSRHECIKMFELVMRALLYIAEKVGGLSLFYGSLGKDFDEFMQELEFKDGER